MGFNISNLKNNKIHQDTANLTDENRNGIKNNPKEESIFLKNIKDLKESEKQETQNQEFSDMSDKYSSQSANKSKSIENYSEIDKDKKQTNEEITNKDIEKELKRLGLERNEANIEKVSSIIKRKNDIKNQIKEQEEKLEKLKKVTQEKSQKQTYIVMSSMAGGGIVGAAVGFKIGLSASVATLNPAPAILGALGGFFTGIIGGGITGRVISDLSTSPNKDKPTQNNEEEIKKTQENIDKLKKQLEML